jgi:uncharacterized protein
VTVQTKSASDQNVDAYAVRSTNYGGSLMISVCDSELVGRILEGGNGLTISMTKAYWQERLVRDKEAESLLTKCVIANLAGKRIVNKAISKKLANRSSVKMYSGIPFLMLFRFTDTYLHHD